MPEGVVPTETRISREKIDPALLSGAYKQESITLAMADHREWSMWIVKSSSQWCLQTISLGKQQVPDHSVVHK